MDIELVAEEAETKNDERVLADLVAQNKQRTTSFQQQGIMPMPDPFGWMRVNVYLEELLLACGRQLDSKLKAELAIAARLDEMDAEVNKAKLLSGVVLNPNGQPPR